MVEILKLSRIIRILIEIIYYDLSRFCLRSIEAYFRFNNNVFPVTLKLLKSMAHTAIRGVSSPLMAMGMLMMLYKKENKIF